QALLDVDDAVRRSEVELSAARAHFGDAAVAEFAAALDAARGEMLRGFTLRRSADERLDAQVAAFDQLRNLEATAPEYLAGLAARLDATNSRLPVAEARWAALQKQYAPGSWEPAAGNLDQARSLLTGATAELAEANKALATSEPAGRPAGDGATRPPAAADERAGDGAVAAADPVAGEGGERSGRSAAVVAGRAAEQAMTQAEALLDGIGRLGTDLA